MSQEKEKPAKRRFWLGDSDDVENPEVCQKAIEPSLGTWWLDWNGWLSDLCGKMTLPRKPK